MRQINLLPTDERGRPADRLRRGVLGILLIVGAFVVILMVGIYLVLLLRLNDLEDQVAELDDEITRQNAHLAELSPYRDLKVRLEDKKPVADGIFRSRFAWDQFFQGLAFVVPETTALDTLTAEAAPVDFDAPVEEPLDPPGTVTFTGIALPRYENVADFVVRMDNLQYLANADLDRAARRTFEQPAVGQVVSFEVASELVTIVGENGTEVKLEGGSQDELADNRGSLRTRVVANTGRLHSSANQRYTRRTEQGRR
ncbi:MAG: PilN domain-containing protein [Actinomycetota bacterium]|nr:PilN domain-containing protein [Actinomycetota bacterium]